jgi:hypothetical protein
LGQGLQKPKLLLLKDDSVDSSGEMYWEDNVLEDNRELEPEAFILKGRQKY